MKTPLLILAAALAGAAAATPASATGKMTCNAPKAQWKSMESLQAQLQKEGWQIRKAKVDGGCYEVYATDPDGNRVEAYFHPVSFKKLLVSRRGEVLFRAK